MVCALKDLGLRVFIKVMRMGYLLAICRRENSKRLGRTSVLVIPADANGSILIRVFRRQPLAQVNDVGQVFNHVLKEGQADQ